ncbi:hypothetical protein [Sulfurimonas sp.]
MNNYVYDIENYFSDHFSTYFLNYLSEFNLNTKKEIIKYLILNKNNLDTLIDEDYRHINTNLIKNSTDNQKALENELQKILNISGIFSNYYECLINSSTDLKLRIKMIKILKYFNEFHKSLYLSDAYINDIDSMKYEINIKESIVHDLLNNKDSVYVVLEQNYQTLQKYFNIKNKKQLSTLSQAIIEMHDSPISKGNIKEYLLLPFQSYKEYIEKMEFNEFSNKLFQYLDTLQYKVKRKLINDLIFNQNSLEDLVEKDCTGLKSNEIIQTNKDIKFLKKYIEYFIKNSDFYFLGNPINKKMKNIEQPLSEDNFIKGGRKLKNANFFNRNDEYYTKIEKAPVEKLTNLVIYNIEKRIEVFEAISRNAYKEYIYERSIEPYEFINSKVVYDKFGIDDFYGVRDYKTYITSMYEYDNNFLVSNDIEESSVLLKLNMNLPRYELESIITKFLNTYHTIDRKKPTDKKIESTINKIVDIFFIYDGKMLNISNDEIIEKLYHYHDKIISPATFQKYLKVAIDLIDNKGYKDIVIGKKTILDII